VTVHLRDGAAWSLLLMSLHVTPAVGQSYHVSGRPSCAQCRIAVTSRMALGSRSDAEILAGMARVVVGNEGRYYAVSDLLAASGVFIYGPRGRFEEMLGQIGEGPGEFDRAWRIAATASGNVYVHDLRGVLHIFGPDRRFKRLVRGPGLPVADPIAIGDTIVALITGGSRPRAVPDREVVLYDTRSGTLIGGVGPSTELRPGSTRNVRAIAPAAESSLWLVQPGAQSIERWPLKGNHSLALTWSDDWARFVDGAPAESGARLGRVWEDAAGRLLWVLSRFQDPEYEDLTAQLAPGQPYPSGYYDPAEMDDRYDTIISVIDLTNGAVVAHQRLDEYGYQFLENGRLVLMREADDGYQSVEIATLELQGFLR
jgi:hypothetical protein